LEKFYAVLGDDGDLRFVGLVFGICARSRSPSWAVWQLASETAVSVNKCGNGSANTYACLVSEVASATGIVQQFDAQDPNGGEGILGMIEACGSM
jgi:hypothetical protein